MPTDQHSFSMASFGIEQDPDAAARSKRVKFFAVGMAIVIAIAAFWISRSSHEPPVAKPAPEKVEKPAPVAVAPAPPPPSASAAPAPVAEKPKEEEKAEKPTRAEAKHRRRAKKSASAESNP